MSIHTCLTTVLTQYVEASRQNFTGHPLAHFLRHEFPDEIARASGLADQLKFDGSAGQSRWVRCPWVAIFDPLVTSSAQSGYYPVYLFREDMNGVYLSLNQAMTEAKSLYRSDAKTALHARAANFRAMLGKVTGDN